MIPIPAFLRFKFVLRLGSFTRPSVFSNGPQSTPLHLKTMPLNYNISWPPIASLAYPYIYILITANALSSQMMLKTSFQSICAAAAARLLLLLLFSPLVPFNLSHFLRGGYIYIYILAFYDGKS